RKANFSVESTRVGQHSDLERLIVEVWTDKTITPLEAIQASGNSLMERFFLFTRLDKEPEEEASPAAGLGISPDVYNTLVETLALSARTLNCLKRAGLNRVGEVISIPKTELLKIRNFGQKSLDELYDKLAERNMLPEDDSSAESDGDTEEAPAAVEGSEEKAIEA
ncbi:MAG: hypothetical protein NZ707_04410, partial [Rhodospirillales bacterium]|nr:hypothetical protein [Rhodospirillales bacterium]